MFLLLACWKAHAAAPKNEPPLQFSLTTLGVPTPAPAVAALGTTLFTLNFVDSKHLLFTYFTRGLLSRLPDSDASDNDGLVVGLLLELPTGKVLARADWRVRDRDTYLWPIGHGRFLFRIRSRLTVLDPMENLASGDAFKPELFGDLKRRIGYISVAPGGELITIETIPPLKPRATAGQAAVAFEEENPSKPNVEIYFYRVLPEKDHLVRRNAGAVAANNLINVPANAEGYLISTRESAGVYDFDYYSHTGTKIELAPYDTSCSPHAQWITRFEFVAFGCHGQPDVPEIGGFNLKGDFAWVEVLHGNHYSPVIVASPESGRFALGRTRLNASATNLDYISPDETTSQEISVRRSYDGFLLQRLSVLPIQRAGKNFDLSPDGLALTVVNAGNIEVYRLPPLTAKDEAELKKGRSLEPPRNDARIRLNPEPLNKAASAGVQPGAEGQTGAGSGAGSAASAASGAAGSAQAAAPASPEVLPGSTTATEQNTPPSNTENTNVVGDVPVGRRTPPTLYDPEHPKKPE